MLGYGAALENMALRSAELGAAMRSRTLPEPARPGLVTELEWSPSDAPADPLARSIDSRHANRRRYRRETLERLARLSAAAESVPGTRLV